MCLKAATKIITGEWQKVELHAICAEASLHAPYSLIKKCAISGAACLLDRPPTHPLHSLLPWNRPKAYNLKAGIHNYARPWTANKGHVSHLQIDGILHNILPLIEDTTQPTRPAKAAIRAYIQQYTLGDFNKRPNPPHTYLPRAPNNTGAKGLLPRRLCHWISSIRLGYGWFPQYLKRIGRYNGKCLWCRANDANRQYLIMEYNAMPYPTTHLMNGLTFRDLAYEDSNLPKLIEILTLNKVGLRVTIQENIVTLQAG